MKKGQIVNLSGHFILHVEENKITCIFRLTRRDMQQTDSAEFQECKIDSTQYELQAASQDIITRWIDGEALES